MISGSEIKRPLCNQEKLRRAIDGVLFGRPTDFETFLLKMEAAGYEINTPATPEKEKGRKQR